MRKYLGLIVKINYIPLVGALLLKNAEALGLEHMIESSEPIVKLEGRRNQILKLLYQQ